MKKKLAITITIGAVLAVIGGFLIGRLTAPAPATTPEEPTPPMPTPTLMPVVPTPTPVEPTPTPATPIAANCRIIHDYQLKDLTEVSTSDGNWLHVEYWPGGDAPEYETILPGGRYILKISFAGGHVWEYAGCTFGQVKAEVDAHISRRLEQKAKNGGYVEWQSTNFFEPVR